MNDTPATTTTDGTANAVSSPSENGSIGKAATGTALPPEGNGVGVGADAATANAGAGGTGGGTGASAATGNAGAGGGSYAPPSTPFPPPEQDLIHELKEKLTFFFWMAQVCIWIHWIVGLGGAISATLAASTRFKENEIATFATIAALCFSIIGFVGPQKRAVRFLTAYRLLDPAIRAYKYGVISKYDLLTTHVKVEAILSEGEFDGK